jgi:VWFA-related protein
MLVSVQRAHPAAGAAGVAAVVLMMLVSTRQATPQHAGATEPFGQAARPPVWRTGIELVALQVTVENRDGQPVQGLSPDDFAVFENGIRQAISTFATAAAPLDLMLLVDISGSMIERMAATQQAVGGLLQTLRFEDRAALLLFADTVQTIQPLTADITAVERSFPRAAAHGGTALHDAVDHALRALGHARQHDAHVRRQALVVISDGEDTASVRVSLADVLSTAERSGVTVFTISPRSRAQTELHQILRPRQLAAAESLMQSLAQAAGGRAFTGLADRELAAAFHQVAADLRCQYWLGYEANPTTPAHRHIAVTLVGRPRWRVRTPGAHQDASLAPGGPP